MTFPVQQSHFEIPEGAHPRTYKDPALQFEAFSPNAQIRTKANAEIFAPVTPQDLSLISSVHGKISRLLLAIPSYVFDATGRAYREGYRSLIGQLPAHTRIEIVSHKKTAEDVRSLLRDVGRNEDANIYEFDDDIAFSVWAEDAFVTATAKAPGGKSATYFIEPFEFSRYADSVIADYVAHASDLENTSAPLYFQGGNVLIGDDFFMVGRDYPSNTLAYGLLNIPNGVDQLEFLAKAYQKYLDPSRKAHFPGATKISPDTELRISQAAGDSALIEAVNRGTGYRQPIFHIDMFISLLGRGPTGAYKVLVGSTREAERILKVSYGDLSLAEQFDQVAEDLTRNGFEVERNPLPLAYRDTTDNGRPLPASAAIQYVRARYGERWAEYAKESLASIGAKTAVPREWYFATSNNVLSEMRADGKTVWLPQYGFGNFPQLAAIDKANKAIWEKNGFEVKGLGDFHAFAYNLGAAHCIKKYLGREA